MRIYFVELRVGLVTYTVEDLNLITGFNLSILMVLQTIAYVVYVKFF